MLFLLSATKLAKKDFDEVVAGFNPNADQQNADSYNGRGYAHVLLGDYLKAIEDAKEAEKWALEEHQEWLKNETPKKAAEIPSGSPRRVIRNGCFQRTPPGNHCPRGR